LITSIAFFIPCLLVLIFIIHVFISAEKPGNAGVEIAYTLGIFPAKNQHFPIEFLFG